MLYVNSRRNKILRLLEENKVMNVNQLISQIEASPATIRKDLSYLENEGHVTRTHGEVSLNMESTLQPFSSRASYNITAKSLIAEQAVSLIHENDSVILDSGTTCYEIAKRLDGFGNITVITTSLPICSCLAHNSNIHVILPGGILHRAGNCLIGPETERFFERNEANIMFLSSSGIRESEGLTLSLPFESEIKKKAIKSAKTVCAVIDSSKEHSKCLNLFARFKDLDCYITDKKPGDVLLKNLNDNGVKVIYP